MTCALPQAKRMKVILLDLFLVNYIVTSAVMLIAGCFVKFHAILWHQVNSAAQLRIPWPMEYSGP